MNKVNQLIKLLHEGNQEVKDFLTVMSVDPDIKIFEKDGVIRIQTPSNYDENLNRKIDSILKINNQ